MKSSPPMWPMKSSGPPSLSSTSLNSQAAQLFLDHLAARQAGGAAGQILAFGTAHRPLHTQAQLFNVEGLGDLIVCAQFQTGDAIAAFVPLGQKDDRDVAGPQRAAQPGADFIAVDVR